MSKQFIPHEYQKNIAELMVAKKLLGIWAEPGTGKTATTLTVLNEIKQKTLVIAPLRIMYSVWPNEIAKWENFNNISYTLLHGKDKEKNFMKNNVGVYIINPEGLNWLEKMITKHKRFPWKILVIDESAKFKSPKTKRFKVMKRMVGMFQYKFLLAGNPIPNSYMDIWSQIFILDKGKRLDRSYTRFVKEYFHQVDYRGFVWAPFTDTAERIQKKIKDISIFIKADDELDLPERVMDDIRFDLPKEITAMYKSMEGKLFSDLDTGKILASNAAVASQKCQQIANGFVYESLTEIEKLEKKQVIAQRLHSIKVELLQDLVEELDGSPLLVGYWFKEDYKMLCEAFPNIPHIGSGTSMEEGVRIEKDWNAKKIPLLFGFTGSVSHGLNLQEAGNHCALYSLLYNADMFDQFIRRIQRQGNTHKRVFVHRFIAKNTVDEAMCLSLHRKLTNASDFLDALTLYRQGERV